MTTQILINDEWVDGLPTIEGQVYRTKIPVGDKYGYQQEKYNSQESFPTALELKTQGEITWRDSELERTNILSLLADHPSKAAILVYRAALRTYPNQPDFPNGARPDHF